MTSLVAQKESMPIAVGSSYIGKIPVRNLWLLLLYASDLFRMKGSAFLDIEDNPDDIADLVAELLSAIVQHRLRRNLNFDYQAREDVLNRVRGRIDLLYTERHQLLMRGKVACRFEELTVNTPRNCYVRRALEKLAGITARSKIKDECLTLAKTLEQAGVIGKVPNHSEILRMRYNHYDKEDRVMLNAAYLAFNLSLLNEEAGPKRLVSPAREEHWVRQLFEKAVHGFYTHILSGQGWSVNAPHYGWQVDIATEGARKILPQMKTDIVLEHAIQNVRIVIDTKFTSIIKRGWHREETLSSGYIYQIYAYLRSQEKLEDPLSEKSYGLLLHPTVDEDVAERVMIQGHVIKFATVNLTASAKEIRDRLISVVDQNQFAF